MMTKGIMVFNQEEQEWRLWIGHQDYWIQQGYFFELFIQGRCFQAYLQKDLDWFITIEDDVKLVLHIQEVYRVSVQLEDFIKVEDPF